MLNEEAHVKSPLQDLVHSRGLRNDRNCHNRTVSDLSKCCAGSQGLALQIPHGPEKTWNDLETFDLPERGLLDPPWQREIVMALLMLGFSFKNYVKAPWSSNEIHSHDNTQSLMFITFQNKKISSVFTLCLLNRKKMKGANRGKTTTIISNFLSYPFHLDALITA